MCSNKICFILVICMYTNNYICLYLHRFFTLRLNIYNIHVYQLEIDQCHDQTSHCNIYSTFYQ